MVLSSSGIFILDEDIFILLLLTFNFCFMCKFSTFYMRFYQFLEKWKKLSEEFIIKRKKKIEEISQSKATITQIQSSKAFSSYLNQIETTDRIVAIGAYTGGTVALEHIFQKLPRSIPPILVVQHMPPNFTYQFAKRLNELCEPNVKEAEDGELLQKGTIYIAPGGYHMELNRSGEILKISIVEGQRVQFQKPSVDVLFKSVSKKAGKNTLAILLTGMGKDGAEGLLEIKKSGGYTIVQDEASSIVRGMPKAAIDIDAANEVMSLDLIDKSIINFTPKDY